jgi:hypothetical protein
MQATITAAAAAQTTGNAKLAESDLVPGQYEGNGQCSCTTTCSVTIGATRTQVASSCGRAAQTFVATSAKSSRWRMASSLPAAIHAQTCGCVPSLLLATTAQALPNAAHSPFVTCIVNIVPLSAQQPPACFQLERFYTSQHRYARCAGQAGAGARLWPWPARHLGHAGGSGGALPGTQCGQQCCPLSSRCAAPTGQSGTAPLPCSTRFELHCRPPKLPHLSTVSCPLSDQPWPTVQSGRRSTACAAKNHLCAAGAYFLSVFLKS